MAKKRGSTASYTVILIFTTALAKALGFGREMSLAYVYGASPVSDAYIVAFSIPTSDGEAGRHGHAEKVHFSEVGTFAAKEVAHACVAFCVAVAECIDSFH